MTQTQNPPAVDTPVPESAQQRRDRIRKAYDRNPSQMTLMLSRSLEVPEGEIYHALPEPVAVPLDTARWEELIRSFEDLNMVHVIVSNGGATLEAFGQFGNFSTSGPFFNVQTKSLDMHIRHAQLAAAYAVEKPGHMDGVHTLSFLFFDPDNRSVFKVFLTFGGKAPSPERQAAFDAIRDRFRLPANA